MEPDDQAYVDPAELAQWKRRDPIALLEARLQTNGSITREELALVRARAIERVEEAAAFALASPYPSFDQLTTDVYA
jgi:pyruvate dehydrogenase E1 component alpha subunit